GTQHAAEESGGRGGGRQDPIPALGGEPGHRNGHGCFCIRRGRRAQCVDQPPPALHAHHRGKREPPGRGARDPTAGGHPALLEGQRANALQQVKRTGGYGSTMSSAGHSTTFSVAWWWWSS